MNESEMTVNTSMLGLKDIKLHVEDTGGSGRPVVLIHGWPLSGKSWSRQVPVLRAAGYRVITYDRRGFGDSDKPMGGYDYDTLAEDLDGLLEGMELKDVTLVGFSMGGGEVVRYLSKYGNERVRSIVLAAAVTPFLMHGDDNPDGPLTAELVETMRNSLEADSEAFYDQFMTTFFSAGGQLKVLETERQQALELARQADKRAALGAMDSFANTDFRHDVDAISVPLLVIHGDSDATVPFEGSGQRVQRAVPASELMVIPGGPHGINVSHADEFNAELVRFLAK